MEQVDQMEKNQELRQLNVDHLKASIAANQAIVKRKNKIFEGLFDSNKHILTDGSFNLKFTKHSTRSAAAARWWRAWSCLPKIHGGTPVCCILFLNN